MRLEKKAIIDEVKGIMDSHEFALMVDYQGLSVETLAELRGKLRDSGAEMLVTKNRFAAIAARELDISDLDKILQGPTAIVSGDGDVTQVAKLLKQFAKEHEVFALKGGTMDRGSLSAEDVDALASIPPREVMLSRFVGTVAAPMSGLVGVMQQKLSTLVYVLKAVEDKKTNA
ncbi:MAG: 50S ribosomal protein L10 [Kiritimatiellae bacterium]|nr:50S ribosomal protein L10 [Kiritimatiellia bacterium]